MRLNQILQSFLNCTGKSMLLVTLKSKFCDDLEVSQ
jgi:hypothetical protein